MFENDTKHVVCIEKFHLRLEFTIVQVRKTMHGRYASIMSITRSGFLPISKRKAATHPQQESTLNSPLASITFSNTLNKFNIRITAVERTSCKNVFS